MRSPGAAGRSSAASSAQASVRCSQVSRMSSSSRSARFAASTWGASPAASSGSPRVSDTVRARSPGVCSGDSWTSQQPSAKLSAKFGGHPQRQPRLADPAGPAQGDEAVPLDGRPDGRQFPSSSDEPGDLGREIVSSLAKCQRGHDFPRIVRPVTWLPRGGHLVVSRASYNAIPAVGRQSTNPGPVGPNRVILCALALPQGNGRPQPTHSRDRANPQPERHTSGKSRAGVSREARYRSGKMVLSLFLERVRLTA